MDHELKMQEIRERQNEKMMKLKEKQEMHEWKVQQSRQEVSHAFEILMYSDERQKNEEGNKNWKRGGSRRRKS